MTEVSDSSVATFCQMFEIEMGILSGVIYSCGCAAQLTVTRLYGQCFSITFPGGSPLREQKKKQINKENQQQHLNLKGFTEGIFLIPQPLRSPGCSVAEITESI